MHRIPSVFLLFSQPSHMNSLLGTRRAVLIGCRLFSGGPLLKPWSVPRGCSFHDCRVFCSAEVPAPLPVKKQRPSKTASKREVQHLQKLATQLCKLSERQLSRLQPLLDARALHAISEAKRISGRNQAKGRQEAFLAKLLRESLEDGQQALLEEAVASVAIGQGVVLNPAVEQQAQLWMEGLLIDDRDVMTEVFGVRQGEDGGVDVQQLRQLVRQVAQCRQLGAGDAEDAGIALPVAHPTKQQQRAEKDLRQALRKLAQQAAAVEETEEW